MWWRDRATGWNVSCPQLVSVAFVTTWWAGPVVDDQGNADQGEQHPQDQEKGSLEQHKSMGYFQGSQHLPHTPGKQIEILFLLFLCPLVSGVCYNHWQTRRIIPRLYGSDSPRRGKQELAMQGHLLYSFVWLHGHLRTNLFYSLSIPIVSFKLRLQLKKRERKDLENMQAILLLFTNPLKLPLAGKHFYLKKWGKRYIKAKTIWSSEIENGRPELSYCKGWGRPKGGQVTKTRLWRAWD